MSDLRELLAAAELGYRVRLVARHLARCGMSLDSLSDSGPRYSSLLLTNSPRAADELAAMIGVLERAVYELEALHRLLTGQHGPPLRPVQRPY